MFTSEITRDFRDDELILIGIISRTKLLFNMKYLLVSVKAGLKSSNPCFISQHFPINPEILRLQLL